MNKKGKTLKYMIIGTILIPLSVYGILWFLYIVAKSFVGPTDLGIDSWLRTVTTLFGTFLGPYATVQGFLWIQSKNERERKDKDMKNSENIIKLFLIHEIKYNFNNVLQGKNTFYNRFKNEDEPKPFGYENDKIKVEEFNKI